MLPLTFFQDGIYISGELWKYWCQSFPRPSVFEMFAFVLYDIDDECTEFVRSLAWWGLACQFSFSLYAKLFGWPSRLCNVYF
jgi:hypothetical protein